MMLDQPKSDAMLEMGDVKDARGLVVIGS